MQCRHTIIIIFCTKTPRMHLSNQLDIDVDWVCIFCLMIFNSPNIFRFGFKTNRDKQLIRNFSRYLLVKNFWIIMPCRHGIFRVFAKLNYRKIIHNIFKFFFEKWGYFFYWNMVFLRKALAKTHFPVYNHIIHIKNYNFYHKK